MSILRNAGAVSSGNILSRNDDRLQIPHYSSKPDQLGQDSLWPRSRMRGAGVNMGSMDNLWDVQAFADRTASVGQRRDQIAGVTRDANGNALAGCTVQLFDDLTDTLVDTVVSDSSGLFAASTPYTGLQVYAVGYLAGTPVFGTTAKLTPS